MKFGIRRKCFKIVSHLDLMKFSITKFFIGFETASNLLRRNNKYSIQLILQHYGATIGKNCDIETGLVFHNCRDFSNLIIGNNVHIGKNCFFDLGDKVKIGDNVTCSMQTTFITHLDVGQSILKAEYPSANNPIEIKENVYIGANCTILKGVVLYEKSFIAAYSLVTKDVLPNTMVGGVPAKLIKELSGIKKTN